MRTDTHTHTPFLDICVFTHLFMYMHMSIHMPVEPSVACLPVCSKISHARFLEDVWLVVAILGSVFEFPPMHFGLHRIPDFSSFKDSQDKGCDSATLLYFRASRYKRCLTDHVTDVPHQQKSPGDLMQSGELGLQCVFKFQLCK